jgi:hypothetical protein
MIGHDHGNGGGDEGDEGRRGETDAEDRHHMD